METIKQIIKDKGLVKKHNFEVEPIEERDKKGNLIHYKDTKGYEYWKKYDKNDNAIHYKNSDGYESWREYDENDNVIHYKNSEGEESWIEYTKKGYVKNKLIKKEIGIWELNGVEYIEDGNHKTDN